MSNKLEVQRTQVIRSDVGLDDAIAELKMAYTFIGVPQSDMSKCIGVAPYGAYHEDGWDGAIQFFDNEKHFSEFLLNVFNYYRGKKITIKTKKILPVLT